MYLTRCLSRLQYSVAWKWRKLRGVAAPAAAGPALRHAVAPRHAEHSDSLASFFFFELLRLLGFLGPSSEFRVRKTNY